MDKLDVRYDGHERRGDREKTFTTWVKEDITQHIHSFVEKYYRNNNQISWPKKIKILAKETGSRSNDGKFYTIQVLVNIQCVTYSTLCKAECYRQNINTLCSGCYN